MPMRVLGKLVALALVLLWSSARQARGDVLIFAKSIMYTQTSSAQPTTPSFSVAGEDLASDWTSGSVTNGTSGASFNMDGSVNYASLAAMNAAFPDGSTDTFSVSNNSQGTLSGTLTQPTNSLFTSNIPYLTNFNQLQGMDPSQAISLDFNSTQPVAGASQSTIFFDVVGVASNGDPDSATSFPLRANSLKPNTTYTFEINYSNYITETAAGGFSGSVYYDVATEGTFTTGSAGSATPEPSSFILFGMAVTGLGVARWRKRKQTT